MDPDRRVSFSFLCALPFIAVVLVGVRPLHALAGHEVIGIVLFGVALVCMWRLRGRMFARDALTARTLGIAGALLLAPWLLIVLLWVGIGAPFQANAIENQQRFVLLMVNVLLVGAGFLILQDALRERGERLFSSALLAAAVPASGLYLVCIAITLAQSTMAVHGDRTPVPPILSYLYDGLEFFACAMTYGCTLLSAVSMGEAGLLGRTAVRVFMTLSLLCLTLLVLGGVEYPEISGRTAPWYTQPGVLIRIPAIPWLMPALLGTMTLRFAGMRTKAPISAARNTEV